MLADCYLLFMATSIMATFAIKTDADFDQLCSDKSFSVRSCGPRKIQRQLQHRCSVSFSGKELVSYHTLVQLIFILRKLNTLVSNNPLY